uniref:DUF7745 domain-containing protein n=1 Tax=Fagus sylvatica TaxID=28930 RepID=A0A2N9GSL4_FAGSY
MTMPTSWEVFGKFPFLMQLRVDRGLLEALASFWDPTHCCFSIGEVDLVPTLEEYAGLLQLDSPFSETPVIPIQESSVEPSLGEVLGFDFGSLASRDHPTGGDLAESQHFFGFADEGTSLGVTFQWSLLGTSLQARRDGRSSESMPSRSPLQVFFLFPTSAGRIDLGVIPFGDRERGSRCSALSSFQLWFCSHLQHFYRLQTPYHFERSLGGQQCGGPGLIVPLFDGVPLPGVWGCTGYYPSLALRQFGGVQYPPRLGDLDAVTFDYIPSEDMWRLLLRIEDIWGGHLSEIVLIEDGLQYGQVHCILWCLALFGFQLLLVSPRGQLFWRESLRRLELSWRHYALPGHLRERSLRLVWSPCGAPCITTVWRWRIFVATWRIQRGNVSTLRTMNDFIREQLEISEAAKDHMEETLTETQGQLETEQISVLQGDNGVLQTELDLVHDALESNASWLNQEGFPVVTALHQINQVMDSLGARSSRRLGGA